MSCSTAFSPSLNYLYNALKPSGLILQYYSNVVSSSTVTTDVQNVTATLTETMDAFVVQCDFITGSNAQGCMVVLVGEFGNITINLEQNGCDILNVSHPLSFYHEIFAFDIETDGSVGTLAVPGVFNINDSSDTTCVPTTSTSSDTSTTS